MERHWAKKDLGGGSKLDSIIEEARLHAKLENRLTGLGIGKARILAVGVGGAGNNTINRLYTIGVRGVETIAVNTDAQHLEMIRANKKVLIGKETTRGLGAGGDPEIARRAAEESISELRESMKGDMVFVAAGMGGGTGTGAAPVIARVAKENGALVIGVVTLPFALERARISKARDGLKELRKHCDTVVAIDNNKLLDLAPHLPVDEAFSVADEVLAQMVKGISETIALPSLINLDFADVKAVMGNGEVAMVGLGESNGRDRVRESVYSALNNPLLEVDYSNCKGALIHITGGPDMTLSEANEVGEIVTENMGPGAQVIWGARVDEEFMGRLRVMVIMTGVKYHNLISGGDEIVGELNIPKL